MKDQQDSSELHSLVNLHLKQLRVKYLYPDDIAAPCIESKNPDKFSWDESENLKLRKWGTWWEESVFCSLGSRLEQ